MSGNMGGGLLERLASVIPESVGPRSFRPSHPTASGKLLQGGPWPDDQDLQPETGRDGHRNRSLHLYHPISSCPLFPVNLNWLRLLCNLCH